LCLDSDFQCRSSDISRTVWWHFPEWSYAADVSICFVTINWGCIFSRPY